MEKMKQKEVIAAVMFMISLVLVYLIGIKVLELVLDDVPNHLTSRWLEVSAVLLLVFFVKCTPFKIQRTGLKATKQEIIRTLLRCGIICLGIVAAFAVARLVMTQYNTEIAVRPWFRPYFHIHMRWLYPFTALLQEFLAKGVMQENMKKLFGLENPMLAIIACSMLFGVFHVKYPLYYMICSSLLSFLTGYIYEKDRSIWGCAMIHFCIGFLPRAMGLK